MKTKNTTQKIVLAAMFVALVYVATKVIQISSPLNGYMNLGDSVVLVAGWMLSPLYGFLAAGLGSALADLFSEYAFYAPVTFAIKGLMALAAWYIYKVLNKRIKSSASRIISGFVAELIMILGYYLFEGIMYGFGASLVNIPANAIQGVAGLILGFLLIKVFEKTKINFQ